MAIVKKYPAKVVDIQSTIKGIYTIELESLDKPFRYEPGQFMHLALDEYDPSAQWPDSRCFSMQSSPGEKLIRITYSVKGRFTERMRNELFIGQCLTLKMPYGDFFYRGHNKANTIFISGGTGITPFLSLFTDHSFSEYENPVLYAGFRKIGMNMYSEWLNLAKIINPGLKINLVYEDTEGPLNISSIFDNSRIDSSYLLSGPPLMINVFKNFLIGKGITEEQIKTDDWE